MGTYNNRYGLDNRAGLSDGYDPGVPRYSGGWRSTNVPAVTGSSGAIAGGTIVGTNGGGSILQLLFGDVPPPPVLRTPPTPGTTAAGGTIAPTTNTVSTIADYAQQTTPPIVNPVPAGVAPALTAADLAALAHQLSGPGYMSPDMAAGVGTTAGLQAIVPTAASTTTKSNPAVTMLIVVLAIGAGIFAWAKLRKKKGMPAAAHGQ